MVTELTANLIEEAGSSNFIEKVIEQSKEKPIVVDFWAPWCNPCKQLTPILEEITNKNVGKVKLIKINVDENQDLAQQLRIQSLPTVMAFFQGKPANGFAGLKSHNEILNFFDELINIASHSQNEIEEIKKLVREAERKLEAKEYDQAINEFSGLITSNLPRNELVKSLNGLGKCFLELNKIKELEEMLDQLEDDIKETIEIKSLIEAKEYFSVIKDKVGRVSDQDLDQRPNDLEIRMQIARNCILKRNYSEAIEHLLFIISKNKSWNEGVAKRELLTLFSYLGNNNDLVVEGRTKLSNTLFK